MGREIALLCMMTLKVVQPVPGDSISILFFINVKESHFQMKSTSPYWQAIKSLLSADLIDL